MTGSVVVTSARGLAGIRRRRSLGVRWLYLGKDVENRRRVEALFGAGNQWQLGGALQGAAAALRQPFLDYVACVGEAQEDSIAWWSSTFSWKVWGASDLFLLVCYLRLAQDTIREALASGMALVLVIEDPWLFRQLKDNFGSTPEVQFLPTGGLWSYKLQALLSGAARRAWWLAKTLWYWVRQRSLWPADGKSEPRRPAVALYSLPMARCFREKGEWDDPLLPGLDRFFRNLGYEVIRFTPPECGGLERDLAERASDVRPLILSGTLRGIGRSLAAFRRREKNVRHVVADMPVDRLAEREWWLETGRASLCRYRMFYECAKELLRRGAWRWVVYPYENQPWEKLLALCARELGLRTVGIQHSTLSRYYLSYFWGEGEAARMPLPDVIWTSGPYPHKALAEGGNPPGRLKMYGSIRYRHLDDRTLATPAMSLGPAPLSEVLVGLPIEIHMVRHLLAAIAAAFPDGGQKEGVRFHIKAHPSCPVDVSRLEFPALEAPAVLQEGLCRCGLVLFIGTTIGPEALAWGRAALRYCPELLLNVDTAEAYGDSIPSCSDSNLREAILALVRGDHSPESRDRVEAATRELFAPVRWELLEEVFRLSGREEATVAGPRALGKLVEA